MLSGERLHKDATAGHEKLVKLTAGSENSAGQQRQGLAMWCAAILVRSRPTVLAASLRVSGSMSALAWSLGFFNLLLQHQAVLHDHNRRVGVLHVRHERSEGRRAADFELQTDERLRKLATSWVRSFEFEMMVFTAVRIFH